MKIAVFPGSFDPITLGHTSIIDKALAIFDKVVVAVGENSKKNSFFTLEQRIGFIKSVYANNDLVSIQSYSGLTVDLCKKVGSSHIIRGVRNSADFEYEQTIANMNKELNSAVETVIFNTDLKYSAISSTLVKEVLKHNGDASKFLPKQVEL